MSPPALCRGGSRQGCGDACITGVAGTVGEETLSRRVAREPGAFPRTYPPGCPGAAADLEALSCRECIRHFSPGLMKVPPRGPSRDTEGRCSLLLLHPLEVNKAKELHLLGKDRDYCPLLVGPALGGITTGREHVSDHALRPGPSSPPGCACSGNVFVHACTCLPRGTSSLLRLRDCSQEKIRERLGDSRGMKYLFGAWVFHQVHDVQVPLRLFTEYLPSRGLRSLLLARDAKRGPQRDGGDLGFCPVRPRCLR